MISKFNTKNVKTINFQKIKQKAKSQIKGKMVIKLTKYSQIHQNTKMLKSIRKQIQNQSILR